MRKFILLLSVFITPLLSGQVNVTKEEIKQKTDSIIVEGNLLYQFEKVAWVSTDQALSLKDIKQQYGGYLIYQSDDSIKAIILDKSRENCIYEMTYIHDFTIPNKEILVNRPLYEEEKELQSVKNKIMITISEPAYQVTCQEGYDLNFELIPYEQGYKLYILTGTKKPDVIPLGNDYIFFANKNGDIQSWRKFHSRLIATPTKYDGEKITGITHSHLRTEPYISATDICTFKLYGSYYGLKQFKVLSTALSTYFTYDVDSNTIEWKTME